jgi:hypothetical protein
MSTTKTAILATVWTATATATIGLAAPAHADPATNLRVVLKLEAGANEPIVLPFKDINGRSDVAVDPGGSVYLNDGMHFRILTGAVGA